jgi:hypothetical protein
VEDSNARKVIREVVVALTNEITTRLDCFKKLFWPEAHPTIASFASAEENYNATGSLLCLENKKILFYFLKTI